MPATPTSLESLLFLRLNKGPGFFLDLLGTGAFHALRTALKLRVFEILGTGPLTSKEVAQRIHADERGTRILLEALESFRYVKTVGDRYVNSPMTVKWLLSSSPTSLATTANLWMDYVFEFWKMHLEESVRTGKPATTIYEWFNTRPGSWEAFQKFAMDAARVFGKDVIAKIRLPETARRVLDVGGGHGLYSIMLCRQHPTLTCTVFDHPEALATARDLISSEKMEGRVLVQPGDYWEDALGTGFDVALLFNIIHANSPEKNVQLLHKVGNSLSPGGIVVIMDQFLGTERSRTLKAINRFFSLNYLVTLGGQAYRFEEVAGWLTTAGFSDPRRTDIRRAGVGLAMATKKV